MRVEGLALIIWGQVIASLSLRLNMPLSVFGLLAGAVIATIGAQSFLKRSH